jgi:hypothetical protein
MNKKTADPQEVMKRLQTAKAQGAGQANMPNVNPDDCPDMLCVNCEGDTFIKTFSFKALSVFQAPPKGGHVQLVVMQCIQCGTPLNLQESMGMAFKRDREEKKNESKLGGDSKNNETPVGEQDNDSEDKPSKIIKG